MDDNTPQTVVRSALIALVIVAVLITVGAMVSVPVATVTLAVVAVVGAVLRIVLPAGVAFSVRRRSIDVVMMLVLAAVLLYLGLTTPLA